jgi:hypothetical protein
MQYSNRLRAIKHRGRFIAGSLASIVVLLIMKQTTVVIAADPTGLDGKPGTYEGIVRSLRAAGYQTVEETNQPARLTLRELAAGQKAWRDSINSISVDLKYRFHRESETTGDRAAKKAGKNDRRELEGEVSFAMKGDKRVLRSTDTSPDLPSCPRTDKEKRALEDVGKPHFWTAFDGQVCRRYEAGNRVGIVDPRKRTSLENEAVAYFEAIFVPVIDKMLPTGKTSWNVEVALNSPKSFKLLPKLEMVDGHLCHVVTSGWDTIWLDPDQGFAVLRRIHFRRRNATDPGELSYLQVCGDFVNAGKNVWLPTKTVQLVYTTYDQPAKDRGKLHWVKEVDAQPQVADLPDSAFQVAFPPGAHVYDFVNKIKYLVPRGEESLDKAIVQAGPLLAARTLPQPMLSRLPAALLWLSGAVPLAVVIVIAARGRRRTTSRCPTISV